MILPHPSTLYRVCSNYKADPLLEKKSNSAFPTSENSEVNERSQGESDPGDRRDLYKTILKLQGSTLVGPSVQSMETDDSPCVHDTVAPSPNKDVIHILRVS